MTKHISSSCRPLSRQPTGPAISHYLIVPIRTCLDFRFGFDHRVGLINPALPPRQKQRTRARLTASPCPFFACCDRAGQSHCPTPQASKKWSFGYRSMIGSEGQFVSGAITRHSAPKDREEQRRTTVAAHLSDPVTAICPDGPAPNWGHCRRQLFQLTSAV